MLATYGLAENRWARAKRAADLFVATLGLFNDPMLDDHVSVSQFSWSCGDNKATGDTTGAVQGISQGTGSVDVPPPPSWEDDSFLADNDTDPAGSNCTPIRQGIKFALNNQLNIGSSSTDKRDRIMVLLSDGFHNMPTMQFDPGTDFSSTQKAFTQIRTVALGPDGSTATDLLSKIATEFNGGPPFDHEAKYNQTDTFTELLHAYIETLESPLTAVNQVDIDSGLYQPGAPDKLVFIGVWDRAESEVSPSELTITHDGTPLDSSQENVDVFVNDDIGYAATMVTDPPAEEGWQITGAEGGADPDSEFVLADLRILARFLIEQKPYAAGDTILLKTRLTDGPEPLLGADASVEVARPDEALGNYLTTVKSSCERGAPSRPKIDDGVVIGVSQGASAPATGLATAGAGGDPIPGRHALAAQHFDRCDKDGLARSTLPGTQLHDDGTHGDVVSDDGIYSLAYTQTTLEGTYNFRFHVQGQTDDGVSFARTRTASQFVGIEPAEAETDVTTQTGPVSGGLQTLHAVWLPKDPLGNYQGPGFAHRYDVTPAGAVTVGGVRDLGNGYYVQTLRYPEGKPKPTITIETPDGGFSKTVDLEHPDRDRLGVAGYWLAIVLVLAVVALVLLILLLRCYRRA